VARPRKYDTEQELSAQVDAYLKLYKDSLTITGLALALGFESRQSIYDYEKNGEFSYIIKRARLHVENRYETELLGDKPTGSIFALKNMGWSDKIETVNKNENTNIEVNETEAKAIKKALDDKY